MAQALSPNARASQQELRSQLMEKDRERLMVVYENLCRRVEICSTVQFDKKSSIYDLKYTNNMMVDEYQRLMHEYRESCFEVRTNAANVSTIQRVFREVAIQHSRMNEIRNKLLRKDPRVLDSVWVTIVGPEIVTTQMGKNTKVVQEYLLFKCPFTDKIELLPTMPIGSARRWTRSTSNIDTMSKENSKIPPVTPIKRVASLEDTDSLVKKKVTFNFKIVPNQVYKLVGDPKDPRSWSPASSQELDPEVLKLHNQENLDETTGTPWIKRRSPQKGALSASGSSRSSQHSDSSGSNKIPGLHRKAKLRPANDFEGSYLSQDSAKELQTLANDEFPPPKWESVGTKNKKPVPMVQIQATPFHPKTPRAEKRFVEKQKSKGFVFYATRKVGDEKEEFSLLEKDIFHINPEPVVSALDTPLDSPVPREQDIKDDDVVLDAKVVDDIPLATDIVDPEVVQLLASANVTGPPPSRGSPFAKTQVEPKQVVLPTSPEKRQTPESKYFTYADATSFVCPPKDSAPANMMSRAQVAKILLSQQKKDADKSPPREEVPLAQSTNVVPTTIANLQASVSVGIDSGSDRSPVGSRGKHRTAPYETRAGPKARQPRNLKSCSTERSSESSAPQSGRELGPKRKKSLKKSSAGQTSNQDSPRKAPAPKKLPKKAKDTVVLPTRRMTRAQQALTGEQVEHVMLEGKKAVVVETTSQSDDDSKEKSQPKNASIDVTPQTLPDVERARHLLTRQNSLQAELDAVQKELCGALKSPQKVIFDLPEQVVDCVRGTPDNGHSDQMSVCPNSSSLVQQAIDDVYSKHGSSSLTPQNGSEQNVELCQIMVTEPSDKSSEVIDDQEQMDVQEIDTILNNVPRLRLSSSDFEVVETPEETQIIPRSPSPAGTEEYIPSHRTCESPELFETPMSTLPVRYVEKEMHYEIPNPFEDIELTPEVEPIRRQISDSMLETRPRSILDRRPSLEEAKAIGSSLGSQIKGVLKSFFGTDKSSSKTPGPVSFSSPVVTRTSSFVDIPPLPIYTEAQTSILPTHPINDPPTRFEQELYSPWTFTNPDMSFSNEGFGKLEDQDVDLPKEDSDTYDSQIDQFDDNRDYWDWDPSSKDISEDDADSSAQSKATVITKDTNHVDTAGTDSLNSSTDNRVMQKGTFHAEDLERELRVEPQIVAVPTTVELRQQIMRDIYQKSITPPESASELDDLMATEPQTIYTAKGGQDLTTPRDTSRERADKALAESIIASQQKREQELKAKQVAPAQTQVVVSSSSSLVVVTTSVATSVPASITVTAGMGPSVNLASAPADSLTNLKLTVTGTRPKVSITFAPTRTTPMPAQVTTSSVPIVTSTAGIFANPYIKPQENPLPKTPIPTNIPPPPIPQRTPIPTTGTAQYTEHLVSVLLPRLTEHLKSDRAEEVKDLLAADMNVRDTLTQRLNEHKDETVKAVDNLYSKVGTVEQSIFELNKRIADEAEAAAKARDHFNQLYAEDQAISRQDHEKLATSLKADQEKYSTQMANLQERYDQTMKDNAKHLTDQLNDAFGKHQNKTNGDLRKELDQMNVNIREAFEHNSDTLRQEIAVGNSQSESRIKDYIVEQNRILAETLLQDLRTHLTVSHVSTQPPTAPEPMIPPPQPSVPQPGTQNINNPQNYGPSAPSSTQTASTERVRVDLLSPILERNESNSTPTFTPNVPPPQVTQASNPYIRPIPSQPSMESYSAHPGPQLLRRDGTFSSYIYGLSGAPPTTQVGGHYTAAGPGGDPRDSNPYGNSGRRDPNPPGWPGGYGPGGGGGSGGPPGGPYGGPPNGPPSGPPGGPPGDPHGGPPSGPPPGPPGGPPGGPPSGPPGGPPGGSGGPPGPPDDPPYRGLGSFYSGHHRPPGGGGPGGPGGPGGYSDPGQHPRGRWRYRRRRDSPTDSERSSSGGRKKYAKINPFEGDPDKYIWFMDRFKEVYDKRKYTEREKLQHLCAHLKGQPLEWIEPLLKKTSNNTFKDACHILELAMGGIDLLRNHQQDLLKNFTPINGRSYDELSKFRTALYSVIQFYQEADPDAITNPQHRLVRDAMEAMGPRNHQTWAEWCFQYNYPQTAESILTWVSDATLLAKQIQMTHRKKKEAKEKEQQAKAASAAKKPAAAKSSKPETVKYIRGTTASEETDKPSSDGDLYEDGQAPAVAEEPEQAAGGDPMLFSRDEWLAHSREAVELGVKAALEKAGFGSTPAKSDKPRYDPNATLIPKVSPATYPQARRPQSPSPNRNASFSGARNNSPYGQQSYPRRPPSGNRNTFLTPGIPTDFKKSYETGECPFCAKIKQHKPFECPTLKQMAKQDKWNAVVAKRLCIHCLTYGHTLRYCESDPKKPCGVDGCTMLHHPVLHSSDPLATGYKLFQIEEVYDIDSILQFLDKKEETSHFIKSEEILNAGAHTPTAIQTINCIFTYKGKSVPIVAILDTGSNSTNIDLQFAKSMGMPLTSPVQHRYIRYVDRSIKVNSYSVCFSLTSADGLTSQEMNAWTIDGLADADPGPDWTQEKLKFSHLKDLPILKPKGSGIPVLLIGSNNAVLFTQLDRRIGNRGEPVAFLTPLGWSIFGRHMSNVYQNNHPIILKCYKTIDTQLDELDKLVRHQNDLDLIGLGEKEPPFAKGYHGGPKPKKFWSCLEKQADEKMKIHKKVDEKGQQFYEAEMPWKDDPAIVLEGNYYTIAGRQKKVWNRLEELDTSVDEYTACLQAFIDKGYVEDVPKAERRQGWYTPHRPVVNRAKTTPVRPVFDCSAAYKGASANLNTDPGPNRLNDIVHVLLRWRRYEYAFTGDISEMFLRVRLAPKDRKYFRFMIGDRHVQWTRVPFGGNACPNISQKVLEQLEADHGDEYPHAVDTLVNSFYMDDGIDSKPTEEEIMDTVQDLIGILQKADMHIGKFYSNSKKVIAGLPEEKRAKEALMSEFDKNNTVFEATKVLGMTWKADGDMITFSSKYSSLEEWLRKLGLTKKEDWTKRTILKAVASTYDPLGLINPCIVWGRVIIQDLWAIEGLDWDDKIPVKIQDRWTCWLEALFELTDIKIPRWVYQTHQNQEESELHTFCDASESVYAASVYLRTKSKGGKVRTILVAGKARVSPRKNETISRLELVACVIGTRLLSAVNSVFEIDPKKCFFWTDSRNALCWINAHPKACKVYVQNRVGEIQRVTEKTQWLHVPTDQNPADAPTRPITVAELRGHTTWWNGPKFLRTKPKSGWGTFDPSGVELNREFEQEMKPEVVLTLRDFDKDPSLPVYNWELMSVGNLYDGLERGTQNLTLALLSIEYWANVVREGTARGRAIRQLLRVAQSQMFEYELEKLPTGNRFLPKNLQALNLFLDKYGILRANTRLANIAAVSEQMKCPIMLKSSHRYTLLIFAQMHIALQHPVSENLFRAKVAEMYKVIGDKSLFKQLRDNCILCQRMHGNPMRQQMAPLPSWRFEKPFRAFSKVGIDFAGPFEIRDGPGGKPVNRYVLLFTCLQIRALHLEICENMKTVSVLNALSRFCDVRGVPNVIFCDNQSSFHAADRELQVWLEELDWNKIREFERTTYPMIEWKYNTPRAPHMGGVYEIMVKAMKRAFRILAKNKILSDESFRTVMSRAAALVNSRPLSHYVREDGEAEILTPNTFLVGNVSCNLTVGHEDEKVEPTRVWRQVNSHVDELWKRFLTEILPELQPRDRWNKICGEIALDDMVLVIDKQTSRGLWKMGRVVELEPSEDGLVRHVVVRMGHNKPRKHAVVNLIKLFSPDQEILGPNGKVAEAKALEKVHLDDIGSDEVRDPRTPIPQFEALKRKRELEASKATAIVDPAEVAQVLPVADPEKVEVPPVRQIAPTDLEQKRKAFELRTAKKYLQRIGTRRSARIAERAANKQKSPLESIRSFLESRSDKPLKERISFSEDKKLTLTVLAKLELEECIRDTKRAVTRVESLEAHARLLKARKNPDLPERLSLRELHSLNENTEARFYRPNKVATFRKNRTAHEADELIEEEVE